MGGSGGKFFPRPITSPEDIRNELEARAKSDEYNQQVSAFLKNSLKNINERDTEAINRHLEEIKKALESEIEGTVDLNFGGSVSKHTYVDGLSDIDSLVLINNSELKGKSPEEVKQYFYDRLRDRFPNTKIEKGKLAVTVKFKDSEIQLLPAIKAGNKYQIANFKGSGWSEVNPKSFTKILTKINQKIDGKLVPTIKLAKSIISTFPEKRQITGYHTEALSIEIFSNYKDGMTPQAMLKYFFKEAGNQIKTPIADKSGQSKNIDTYLGKKESLERKLISDSFSKIYRKLNRADLSSNDNVWKELLDT